MRDAPLCADCKRKEKEHGILARIQSPNAFVTKAGARKSLFCCTRFRAKKRKPAQSGEHDETVETEAAR